MHLRGIVLVLFVLGSSAIAPCLAQSGAAKSDLQAWQKARDAADVSALRNAIAAASQQAKNENSARAYEHVALLDHWLCEAAHGKKDEQLIKQAAEDGVEAARRAAQLDPQSSEAHRLEGELLGELIPHVFAGGMRYGGRSTGEIEKAIELDPKNVNAYIARAIGYFYTPAAFGGSSDKAAGMLNKALGLDPASDTAHIWLAQVYLQEGKTGEARREITEALRLNPGRGFAQSVLQQVAAKEKQGRS